VFDDAIAMLVKVKRSDFMFVFLFEFWSWKDACKLNYSP